MSNPRARKGRHAAPSTRSVPGAGMLNGTAGRRIAATGGVISQAEPLVAQLRQTGVPTVGDLTGKLSDAQLPMVGSVGSLTQTLPVTGMLGADSPVTGVLQNAGSL